MRFAGTWKQYSKKAIPQLARTTFQSASLRNFKWPYHAKVMKILDTMSNRIVRIGKGAPCTVPRYRLDTKGFTEVVVPSNAECRTPRNGSSVPFSVLDSLKSRKKPPTLSNCFVRCAPDSRDAGGPKAPNVNAVIHDPVVDQPIAHIKPAVAAKAAPFCSYRIHVRKQ